MSEDYIRKADAIKQCGFGMTSLHIADNLRKMRPADVVPVRHGKWMKEDRGHVEYCAVCDQCGFDWMWSDRVYFKFCPNCGADMRGEQE